MIESELTRIQQENHECLSGDLNVLFSFTSERLQSYSFNKPYFIGVAGTSGSGKSTISRKLADHLSSQYFVSILDMDVYLDDRDKEKQSERDSSCPPFLCGFDPLVFNLDTVSRDIQQLAEGKTIEMPIYDRKNHRRMGTAPRQPTEVIIVEGMRALDEEIASLMNQKCFIEADLYTRLLRRILRNFREFERTDLDSLVQRYLMDMEPGYQYYLPYLRQKADIIVLNEGAITTYTPIKAPFVGLRSARVLRSGSEIESEMPSEEMRIVESSPGLFFVQVVSKNEVFLEVPISKGTIDILYQYFEMSPI